MAAPSDRDNSHPDSVLMRRYVVNLRDVGKDDIAMVGGKAANLGELTRVEAIRVPRGFCVTTMAFRRIMQQLPSLSRLIDQLPQQDIANRGPEDTVRALSAEIRATIEACAISTDVADSITDALTQIGLHHAYAVRSSATAEDLATASFAGLQDTYLNVTGRAEILRAISRCCASMFSERAVMYRAENGIDHDAVAMAVIVQQMAFPRASGVLFTADPLSGNRTVSTIESIFGLGEALVSGNVTPDTYSVRDDKVINKTIGEKAYEVEPRPEGGTQRRATLPEHQHQLTLTDVEAIRLARIGRTIESHFGRPQDIEWCLTDDDFLIVQSRPITTLFPIPDAADGKPHVYLSTGHQQMMTDAQKPLGISIRQLTAARSMYEAGGRLCVDVSRELASASGRAGLLGLVGTGDSLIGDALQTLIARDFVPLVPETTTAPSVAAPTLPPLATDPAIVAELVASGQASNARLNEDIQTKSTAEVADFIIEDTAELRRVLFDRRSHQAIMAGMDAMLWLNKHIEQWLGEKNVADTLSQSAPNNVTAEMGLELLRVADVIREHPSVIAFLERSPDDDFLIRLSQVAGGDESRDAIQRWLDKYGMRGVGEIDITRPRWSEQPTALIPLLLSNVRNFTFGEDERRFAGGLRAARAKQDAILAKLRTLPNGEQKAAETASQIERLRTFVGYREYPKYFIVNRYFAYKRALMRVADDLVASGVLPEREDIFYVTMDELREITRAGAADLTLLRARKAAFREFERLVPPRVLTSEGEMLNGAYRRADIPAGALVGLGVSAGTVEGRARVVRDLGAVQFEPGDILVTPFTDPSWTPAFVAIAGLITEVGGLMTHGAVIAREYGLPAIVNLENATRLIRDGQRIRLHGAEGYVEFVP